VSETVLVAVIGLVGSGLGSLLGILASSKLTQYRLEQLEKKVQAHNNLVERMYKVENHEGVVDEQIKVINHRIEDLEHEI